MATLRRVRTLALSLPETTEEAHHGVPSFRVRGRIFATVPDDGHLRVMADEPEILAACAEAPEACEPGYWGHRLAFVLVALRDVPDALLTEIVTDAWTSKGPPSAPPFTRPTMRSRRRREPLG